MCDAPSVQGAFYASPVSPDAAGMLMWRPFDSWAPGGEWQLSLAGGEEAIAVAAGDSFTAAATSARLLRIFTHTGTLIP